MKKKDKTMKIYFSRLFGWNIHNRQIASTFMKFNR